MCPAAKHVEMRAPRRTRTSLVAEQLACGWPWYPSAHSYARVVHTGKDLGKHGEQVSDHWKKSQPLLNTMKCTKI